MRQLDETDFKILEILQKDSSISIKEIAAKIGLSFTPTYERIKRMEEDIVIKKYVALVDREKIGLGLLVYCNITLKEQSQKMLEAFEKSVCNFEEVIEVMSLSGTYDYMLKIAAKDISGYNEFVVTKLANVPNIGQYHSSIVMAEIKKETAYKTCC